MNKILLGLAVSLLVGASGGYAMGRELGVQIATHDSLAQIRPSKSPKPIHTQKPNATRACIETYNKAHKAYRAAVTKAHREYHTILKAALETYKKALKEELKTDVENSAAHEKFQNTQKEAREKMKLALASAREKLKAATEAKNTCLRNRQ